MQIARLRTFLKTDQAATLQSVQHWLATQQGVHYSLGSISLLFKRLKIKLKTGRPTNVRQDKAGLLTFKKNFPQLKARYQQQIYFQDEMCFGTRIDVKRH